MKIITSSKESSNPGKAKTAVAANYFLSQQQMVHQLCFPLNQHKAYFNGTKTLSKK
jgi:hypothetical protein